MDKKPKRAQLSVDRAPTPSRWRARALLSLIWKFPLVARPRNPDGVPAPPHFETPKTRTSRVRAMGVARSRGVGRTHLNEGYFGDFTFPGHGPSISQAQFDLYGGGTAEAQHTFSHFINFSLRACADISALRLDRVVHYHVFLSGYGSDSFVQAAIVLLYPKYGALGVARRVFDEMTDRSVVAWNSIISGYEQNGAANEAL
ncbi:hypothetical protein PIB30_079817, partial [Stylosanthes scabra]|nr:hypothetical protein [Stylosanthes scabra]